MVCFVTEKSAHLYIVVDTNILLSYVTFLEQMLELLKTNEMASLISSEGLPGFKLVFVVPYIVMVELDKLKANKKGTRVRFLLPFKADAALPVD